MGILGKDGRVTDADLPLPGVVIAAHDEAVRRGEPGYRDPTTGLFVMTAAYLSGRGLCCGNGCRHCPYS